MSGLTLLRVPGDNTYCGPAALALIAGVPVCEAAAALREVTGKKQIRAVAPVALVKSLRGYGYRVEATYRANIWGVIDKRDRPTLVGWLRQTKLHRRPDQMFLVLLTGHYIVVHGRTMYDNRHPAGVALAECKYRRRRVVQGWLVAQDRKDSVAV